MQEMKKRLDELQEVINQYSRDFVSSKETESVTDTFYNLKKEITRNETGDFEFQQNEGGDPYPVKVAANGSAYVYAFDAINYGRKGNNFWVEVMQGDMDGDWESVYYLDDFEVKKMVKEEKEENRAIPVGVAELNFYLSTNSWFQCWMDYYMDMAELSIESGEIVDKLPPPYWVNVGGKEVGKDSVESWVKYCLDSVEDNMKYLKMGELRV